MSSPLGQLGWAGGQYLHCDGFAADLLKWAIQLGSPCRHLLTVPCILPTVWPLTSLLPFAGHCK